MRDIQEIARLLAGKGRGSDTILAHINPEEAMLLDRVTDGGSINPITGLPEFDTGAGGDDASDDASGEADASSPAGADSDADAGGTPGDPGQDDETDDMGTNPGLGFSDTSDMMANLPADLVNELALTTAKNVNPPGFFSEMMTGVLGPLAPAPDVVGRVNSTARGIGAFGRAGLTGITGIGMELANQGLQSIADVGRTTTSAKGTASDEANEIASEIASSPEVAENMGVTTDATPSALGSTPGGMEPSALGGPGPVQTALATKDNQDLIDALINGPGYTRSGQGIIYT